MDHKTLNIFEKDCFINVTEGLKLAKCMKVNIDDSSGNEINELNKRMDELCISDTLFCSFCNMAFEDKVQQREHYKLDWHRYNLKQNLMGRSMVLEEEFQQLADDVSSISGSESDSDDDDDDESDASPSKRKSNDANNQKDSAAIHKLQVERHSKVFFENADGKILSVYRCILQEKKNALEDSELITSLMQTIDKPSWAIIMLGGGHFAAGVFEGSEPVVHKTFHSYTVRARQGGTQSSRDGRSGGSHPKSAGASLRRYNEASFNQHVQDILTEWTNHLEACSLIICRAVGHNRSLLFGGRHPPLNRNDSRVRTIPFPTRRATFKEVQRIHKMLSSIEVYGPADKFQTSFPQSPKKMQQKSSPDRKAKLTEADVFSCISRNKNYEEASEINKDVQGDMRSPRQKKKIDRSKARPSPSRPLPEVVTSILAESSPQESDEGETTWLSGEHEVSFQQDLKEYEDTVPPSIKEKKRKKFIKDKEKKKQNRSSHSKEKVSEAVRILREKLIAACKLSNTTFLQECLESSTDAQHSNNEKCSNEVSHEELLKCLNEHVTDNGSTLLHIAAENGNTVIVRSLLEAGCDPSLKNKKAQPPFAVSADRETRHTFRKFMGEFPEKYDYRKSQIPGPLTDEMEQQLVEKKKEVKKVKRDRQKDKKREETEMDRFLKLSDREKRALAAERRIIANNVQGKSDFKVVSRCFECAADISGKVPFEYDIHRFCTMDCLKKHRLKMKMQCPQK